MLFQQWIWNCSVTSRTGEHSWVYPGPPGRFSHKAPTGINSWIPRMSWESQLSDWLCFFLVFFFFVKPPLYLEFGELTRTPTGLGGWSSRKVGIKGDRGKKTSTKPGMRWPEHTSWGPWLTWAKLLYFPKTGSTDTPELWQQLNHLQTSLPVHQEIVPESYEIRYTRLCSALVN